MRKSRGALDVCCVAVVAEEAGAGAGAGAGAKAMIFKCFVHSASSSFRSRENIC